jgi:hypothetical protein
MKSILIIMATAAVTAPLVLYMVRRIQSSKMRKKIAAEGFETAMDVLYPHKRRMFSKYRMGPVVSQ